MSTTVCWNCGKPGGSPTEACRACGDAYLAELAYAEQGVRERRAREYDQNAAEWEAWRQQQRQKREAEAQAYEELKWERRTAREAENPRSLAAAMRCLLHGSSEEEA